MTLTSAKVVFLAICVWILTWTVPKLPTLFAPKETYGAVGGWLTLLPLAGSVVLILFTLCVAALVYITRSVAWTVAATVVLAGVALLLGFLMLLADVPKKN